MRLTSIALAWLVLAGPAPAQQLDKPSNCHYCAEWNKPQAPFNIYGNTWYVGTRGLSALLVTGAQGHVLLDGALPQSAPLIAANIKALGFRLEDVKLILNSHAHFDHAGGIPALQRATGATVAASPESAQVLRNGRPGPDDPQYEDPDPLAFAKIAQVKEVADGETVRVGPLALTAHMTPGHTPGGTTWTWRSCENDRCLDLVYADSLNPVSGDSFKYSGDARRPDISRSFRASIAKVANLPCDIVIAAHPGFTDAFEKNAARTPTNNPFIDANGCRTLAASSDRALTQRLARERVQ